MNSKIKRAAGGDKDVANALRMQYGFGDEAQLAQLSSILNGGTKLVYGGTDGKAQTVADENGNRTVYMTKSDNWMDMGLTLGHEAYRDGVTGTQEEQFSETMNAVLGHTTMALRMGGDSLYAKEMNSLISNNDNLRNDVIAYISGSSLFANYVYGTYDYSADYWRVQKDEAGNVISVLDDGDYENYTIVEADGTEKIVKKSGSQKNK